MCHPIETFIIPEGLAIRRGIQQRHPILSFIFTIYLSNTGVLSTFEDARYVSHFPDQTILIFFHGPRNYSHGLRGNFLNYWKLVPWPTL